MAGKGQQLLDEPVDSPLIGRRMSPAVRRQGSWTKSSPSPRVTRKPGDSPKSSEHSLTSSSGDVPMLPNDRGASNIETLRQQVLLMKSKYEKWKADKGEEFNAKVDDMRKQLRAARKEAKEARKEAKRWRLKAEATEQTFARAQEAWVQEKDRLFSAYQQSQRVMLKFKEQLMAQQSSPASPPSPQASAKSGKDRRVTERRGTGGKSKLRKAFRPKVEPQIREVAKDSTPLPSITITRRHRVRKVDDFDLLALIGQGGFGSVFLCREKRGGRVVALKRMLKQLIIAKNQVKTVITEVEVLKEARCENSFWLVQLHYAFSDATYLYLAMDFGAGGDLRNLIDNVQLDEDDARFYAAEMIIAVHTLHVRGFVHRDLKPDNFLIGADGHLRLADFGLSKAGFSGKDTTPRKVTSSYTPIRIFLEDETYKTVPVAASTTVGQVVEIVKTKLKGKVEDSDNFMLYECSEVNGATFERAMKLDDKPLMTAQKWRPGYNHKFFLKKTLIPAKARRTVRDPFAASSKRGNRLRLNSVVGSPHYMAAEILEGSGYEAVVDWWSIGCILFEMIVGEPPFYGDTPEEVFSSILNYEATLEFPVTEERDPVSPEAQGIIRGFLCPPKQRLGYNGIGEIKAHEFFKMVPWSDILSMTPPFVPDLDDEADTSYFSSATTEGIESMRIDDFDGTSEPLEDDPFEGIWDWSACE